jgi:MFS family permease
MLRKIYLYRILDNFMLIYPLYAVMFAQRGGLDTFQISMLFIIWVLASMAAEVPTGALADRYSRRNLLVIGECIRSIGYLSWLVWPTYMGFALGFVLWGVGGALDSGTFEALVYDELKAAGTERMYARVIGRTESLSLFVGLAATLLATPVFAHFGYGAVLVSSVAACIAAAMVAATLPDKKRQESTEGPTYFRIMRDATREVAHSPNLIRVIAFGVLLTTLFGVLDEYETLFLKDAGVVVYLIPVVSAAVYFPAIVAGFFAHRLEHLRSATFMLLTVAAGVALFTAGRFLGLPGIVSFGAFLLLVRVSEIVYGAKLQHGIQGQARSTVTSINSLGVSVASIGAYLLYGLATRMGGTVAALELFGLVTAVLGVIMLVWSHGHLIAKVRAS